MPPKATLHHPKTGAAKLRNEPIADKSPTRRHGSRSPPRSPHISNTPLRTRTGIRTVTPMEFEEESSPPKSRKLDDSCSTSNLKPKVRF